MKKYLLLFICLFLCSCAAKEADFKDQVKGENITFKEKYEKLNGTKYTYKEKKYEYTTVEIKEKNNMVELSYDELLSFLDEGTGLLLFARESCPWCRLFVPILIDYTNEVNENVYWYNAVTDRNENNLNYRKLVEIMYDNLPTDTYTQSKDDEDFDPDKHGITQPMLFFIKDGKIVGRIYGYSHEYLQNEETDKMTELIQENYEKIHK